MKRGAILALTGMGLLVPSLDGKWVTPNIKEILHFIFAWSVVVGGFTYCHWHSGDTSTVFAISGMVVGHYLGTQGKDCLPK